MEKKNFNGPKKFVLKGSVGNMMDNDEVDVMNVKNALFQTGHRKTPAQNGIIDQETDDAIRSFQKEKGLKIDGYLKPKGETEKVINQNINVMEGIHKDEYFGKIKKTFYEYSDIANKLGLKQASKNLNYYLESSGKSFNLSSGDLINKQVFQDGVKTNKERFQASFIDKNHAFYRQIINLKDGEVKPLKNKEGDDYDYWDYETNNTSLDFKRNHILRGDIDEALATGSNKIRSIGKFRAKRVKNKIYLGGNVDHNWYDKYDFNSGGSESMPMRALEKYGYAKSYDITGKESEKVHGYLILDKDEVKKSNFSWFK